MIYMHQLHETEAAEAYCDRIYKYFPDSLSLPLDFSSSLSFSELTRKAHSDSLDNTASMVYLCLLKVQLALSTLPSPTGVGTILSTRDALNLTITTAEKYCDRLNPCDVLDILPPSAPLALLQTFLSKSIESANSRKRNLQVSPSPHLSPSHGSSSDSPSTVKGP
jgi:hypothetical protein